MLSTPLLLGCSKEIACDAMDAVLPRSAVRRALPLRLALRLALFICCSMALLLVSAATAHANAIIVTDAGDTPSANCTLREAIDNANHDNLSGSANCVAGSGNDTITFQAGLAGSTIILVSGPLSLTSTIGIFGGGVITGGSLLGGASGYAGELGHVRVSSSTVLDSAGIPGTLEAEVSRAELMAALGLTRADSAEFEAALAGCEVCSDSTLWKDLGNEIAELALTRFVDPQSGALREFFDENWDPAPGIPGRIVEPGHQFEWAWLLLRWGGVKNTRARAVALKLIDIGESHGVRDGLATNSLLDDFSAHDAGARLWPQTERLKAAAIAARLTGEAKYFTMAVAAADGLLRYLDSPTPGLWYDRIDAQGNLVDEPAPASTFYHLVAAIAEISALARFS